MEIDEVHKRPDLICVPLVLSVELVVDISRFDRLVSLIPSSLPLALHLRIFS